MKDQAIFQKCPVYTSDHFRLQLVEEGNAEDLLECYSDASSVRLMNSDNCSCDFHFRTLDEMIGMIRGWIGAYKSRWGAYEGGACIRFCVIDTQTSKAIGTIEMFDKTEDVGILRLDLCSAYESREYILELAELSTEKLHEAFGVKQVLTKAIPDATERISALRACGFTKTSIPRSEIRWAWIEGKKKRGSSNTPFGDYYAHDRR